MADEELPTGEVASPYFQYQIDGSQIGAAGDSGVVGPPPQTPPAVSIAAGTKQPQPPEPESGTPQSELPPPVIDDQIHGPDYDPGEVVGRDDDNLPGNQSQGAETRLQNLENEVKRLEGDRSQDDPLDFMFMAAITGTGTDGSLYTIQEQTNVGGTIGDFPDGRFNTSATEPTAPQEINGWKFIPVGTVVFMMEILDVSACQRQFVHVPPPPPDQSGATDYVLGYKGADQAYFWYTVNTCASEPADVEGGSP